MREEFIQHEVGTSVRVMNPFPDDFGLKTGVIADMHMHKEYEFLKMTSGVMTVKTPDSEVTLTKGDILFINSYVPHTTYAQTYDQRNALVQFKPPSEKLHYLTRYLNVSNTPVYLFKKDLPETEELSRCIGAILAEVDERKAFWNEYVDASVSMMVAILRRYGVLSDVIYERADDITKVKPAISYIEENYNKEISTANLAQLLNFNESYFCRLFKKAIGTSAIDYINFVRVCKAEKLLGKDVSLSEVAYETGFSSLSYFNRVFKKYNYYTPSEYKKIMKNRKYEKRELE